MQENWKLLVLILKETAKAKGIEQSEIIEKTGISQKGISNIFTLKTEPKIGNYVKIAEAIGTKFFTEEQSGKVDMQTIYKNALAKFEKLEK